MTIKYIDSAVAFIDILGFSDLVLESESNTDVFNRVTTALNGLNDACASVIKRAGAISDCGTFKLSTFSDCVVMSVQRRYSSAMLVYASEVANQLLQTGFLCRGGIAVGAASHSSSNIVGPAFIKAYVAESKYAVYPRILVDASIVDEAINKSIGATKIMFESMLKIADDGTYFLNIYSSPLISVLTGNPSSKGHERRTYEDTALATLKFGENIQREDVLMKYRWARTQFMQSVYCTSEFVEQLKQIHL